MLKNIVLAPIVMVDNIQSLDYKRVVFDYHPSKYYYYGVLYDECFISLNDKQIYPVIMLEGDKIEDEHIKLLENEREYVFTNHILELNLKNITDQDKMKLARMAREAIKFYEEVKKEVEEQQKNSNILYFRAYRK